jgi:hypothetical protein
MSSISLPCLTLEAMSYRSLYCGHAGGALGHSSGFGFASRSRLQSSLRFRLRDRSFVTHRRSYSRRPCDADFCCHRLFSCALLQTFSCRPTMPLPFPVSQAWYQRYRRGIYCTKVYHLQFGRQPKWMIFKIRHHFFLSLARTIGRRLKKFLGVGLMPLSKSSQSVYGSSSKP